jgi:phosphoserine phosphatase RsbU/P
VRRKALRDSLPASGLAGIRFVGLALIWLIAGLPLLRGQSFDAANNQKPSYIDSSWRVRAGDDPAWSFPDYDDSAWMLVDPYRNLLEYFPNDQPSILWYRIRVKVAPYQVPLAMSLEEDHLSHAFEIFINGERLMVNGRVSPYKPYTYFADKVALIPVKQVESGSLVIALRVHLSKGEWSAAVPGLNYNNVLIGRRAGLRDTLWLRWITTYAGSFLAVLLGLVVGVMALALYSAQRERTEYLWICFVALGYIATFAWEVLLRTRNVPLNWATCCDGILLLWTVLGPVFMYLAFLKVKIGRWQGLAIGFASALALIEVVGGDYDWMSPSVRLALSIPLLLIAYLAIPILLIVHWRRGNREAGILLIPALLQSLVADFTIFMGALAWIPRLSTWAYDAGRAMTNYHAGPFDIRLTDVGNWLFWIALGTILVLRTIRISREQARMEGDLEAARQVQHVILPEESTPVPGYSVESVYRPAQQVGGDFYQVWPTPDDGLLLVLGDVSGKGLPAAMQVAVLIGSIRTLAQITSDPSEILKEMNSRLMGRTGGGFSTCLAVNLSPDGSGILASAGHPPPFLDGREIEVPGALPLGIAPFQCYESCKLRLEPGGRLTFYSDGVLEAQSPRGELLGFDRVRELSVLSAKEIADAASAFGQEDDITVVVIERGAAPASQPH